jgi:hypothetical protein
MIEKYQPKIEPEAVDPATEQFEKELKKAQETIKQLEFFTARANQHAENLKMIIANLKLEKLKQSREGYSNLESESV